MSLGTGGWPGWLSESQPNAAAEWLAESDSDAGQSVSRACPSWAAPVRTTSVRTFGPKADCRRGSSWLGRDDSWPKGQTQNSNFPAVVFLEALNQQRNLQAAGSRVRFVSPARPPWWFLPPRRSPPRSPGSPFTRRHLSLALVGAAPGAPGRDPGGAAAAVTIRDTGAVTPRPKRSAMAGRDRRDRP